MTADRDEIRRKERDWQNRLGGALQAGAYGRSGTRVVLERQFERIAMAMAVQEGHRVLDVGCGVGHLLSWLAPKARVRCWGVDISTGSLNTAAGAQPGLKLAAADAEALPYADGSFDRVCCNGVGHHLLDFDAAAREMYRVLIPGGIVVFYEPVATALANLVRRIFVTSDQYESPADLAHKHEFSPEFMRTALTKAGFSVVRETFHDFLAYPLTGMYVALPTSHWSGAVRSLASLESRLERLSFLTPLLNALSWRLLVVAAKPGEQPRRG